MPRAPSKFKGYLRSGGGQFLITAFTRTFEFSAVAPLSGFFAIDILEHQHRSEFLLGAFWETAPT